MYPHESLIPSAADTYTPTHQTASPIQPTFIDSPSYNHSYYSVFESAEPFVLQEDYSLRNSPAFLSQPIVATNPEHHQWRMMPNYAIVGQPGFDFQLPLATEFDNSLLDNTIESSQTISETGFTFVSDKGSKYRSKSSRSSGQPTNVNPGNLDRKTVKRLRNRVSASRCRKKKKEWLNELGDESMCIQDENTNLEYSIRILEDQIASAREYLRQCEQERSS
ncbi:hypothetical protein BC833DRAFT_594487 [Globomyces pollinis-pini]|nr:hypothetical protein BC833DRAFT_594487 [Globomyces pollinis-pini]